MNIEESAINLEGKFPLRALLPKEDTQVEQFLEKYPHYDGNDVLIAIFDSGIDPGAPGMQILPNGERKIVDLIDCSGAGDVDTSTVVQPDEAGTILGLSGRKLKIPSSWNNPSNNYHVGIKNLYSLLPASAVKRLKKERKEETWDPIQKLKCAEASKNCIQTDMKSESTKSQEESLHQENLKNLGEVLKTLDQKYDDVGPVFDCVVFYDGKDWKACVDTSETGDLEKCTLMGSFKVNGEFSRFSSKDMMNYSFNIYDDGNTLSIVSTSSSHGTHVASIATAHFPQQSELNGLAPGAKLISMQIGDNRFDGMETGCSIIRAVKFAIANKVDIVNMSYGEAAKWTNSGRVVEWTNKMVQDHNIIFLSSAGNNGPALSTVGCPGPTSEDAIGVGAFVSPEMMVAEYSVLEKVPGTLYHWSSRGPCADGSLGVSICAPGGAITSVPNWTLSRNQLMNGTSMSSPNATGSVGVLLSALKKESICYSPRTIRRALETTALKIKDVSAFDQGYGLIQIEKSYEFVKTLSNTDEFHHVLHLTATCNDKKGIYIRDKADHFTPEKYVVTIIPIFKKHTDNDLKIKFNINIALKTDAKWVKIPEHIDISNKVRSFPIKVETKDLAVGAHFTEIQGIDVKNPSNGPVFRFPITVIVPQQPNSTNNEEIKMKLTPFEPACIQRRYLAIPEHATWANVKLQTNDTDNDTMYIIHALYLDKEHSYADLGTQRYITMKANCAAPKDVIFQVMGGKTLEIAFAKSWSAQSTSNLNATVSFHSLQPDLSEVAMLRSKSFVCVSLTSHLGFENVNPSVSLTHHLVSLVPKEYQVSPLGDRDTLPDNEHIYVICLTYQLNMSKAHDVTLYSPWMHDILYESCYESQLIMVYDSNKSLCGKFEALPFKNNYKCKLEKGDYTVRMQLRHSNVDLLEHLKDMPLNILITLPTPVQLDIYSKRKALLEKAASSKFKNTLVNTYGNCKVYVAAPADDKYPKNMKTGDSLVGNISYSNRTSVKSKVTYPFKLINDHAKPESSKKEKKQPDKITEDDYDNAYVDFLVTWAEKLEDGVKKDELLGKCPQSLYSMNVKLNFIDKSKERKEKLDEIIQLSSDILSKIDEQALLSYIGTKVDCSDDNAANKKKMERLKSIYINSNEKLGVASSEKFQGVGNEHTEEQKKQLIANVNNSFNNLKKVLDSKDSKLLLMTIQHGLVHKHYGRSLKALLKYTDDNGFTKAHYQTLITLVGLCGWDHMLPYFVNNELMKFPLKYQPF